MMMMMMVVLQQQPTARPRPVTLSMVLVVVIVGGGVVSPFLFGSPCHAAAAAACNGNDRNALFSFFTNISYSSSTSLNWSSSVDCCLWEGVGCDDADGRVTQLLLPSRGLIGIVSPSLANLTRLSYLDLSRNHLSGPLPFQFFTFLQNLQFLDLSYNRLSGELPISHVNTSINIQIFNLSSNHFRGDIPLASWNVISFNISNNSFTGTIPSYICFNSPGLRQLDFSYNAFSDRIPAGLGQCSELEILRAGFNNLSGTVPEEIYRIASLRILSLSVNHLSGPISDSIVNLTNLQVLELYSNQFKGFIPKLIGKLSNLEKLQLHINNLTGSLPLSLVNCTKLTLLNLRVNNLVGNLSDFDFSSFTELSTLDLGNNNFTGILPRSLYSCKSLTAVRLASNQLVGQISPDILALEFLSFLSLSYNRLTNITGAIRILMGCKNLTALMMSKSFMNEQMPQDGNTIDSDGFQNLQVLALGGGNFTGQVPTWLAKLKNLEVLDLSINGITGPIPGWLGNLTKLFYIDFSHNLLSGEFPKELTALPALVSQAAYDAVDRSYLELPVYVMPNNATNQQYNQLSNLPPAMYLANNSLSGHIPVEIGRLKSLHVLDISNNNLSGTIPHEISNLSNLEKLDFSGNHLYGEIPPSLKGLHFLSSFSVAYNNLQGTVPLGGQFDTFPSSSFEGNPELCGPIVQRFCPNSAGTTSKTASHKTTNTKLVVGLVLGICFGAGVIISMLALWILSKKRVIPGGDPDKMEMDTILSTSNFWVHPEAEKDASLVILFPHNTSEIKDLTISELLKATEHFNQANIVGCGGFGLVYQATLANGMKLAIKKLSGDLGLMEREFKAEVEALSTAQHNNLVTLQGYCVYEGLRLLIYSYMENGSLDYWLHEKSDGASQLDWPTRLKIARGTSCGLAYLHQTCQPHIVHRDIKSSNILLDDQYEAHLADFGLARLILPYETHVTTELVGTLGYIPPEYGQAWVATLRGDMYSFGVVLLELLTGKRPIDVLKPKMSRELVGWVQKMRSEGKQDQVFDSILRGKGFDGEMLQVLDVACMCVSQNPLKRPTITEVVELLNSVGVTHKNENKDS